MLETIADICTILSLVVAIFIASKVYNISNSLNKTENSNNSQTQSGSENVQSGSGGVNVRK